MSHSRIAYSFALSILGFAGFAGIARAGDAGAPMSPVRWDTDAAVLGGSACVNGIDAWVLKNGGDVSMVFSNLGVALGHGSPAEGAGACSVRLPAEVPSLVFPSSLSQSYEYGVTRTSGASGSLATVIRFLGIAVTPLPLSFVEGDAGSPSRGARLRVSNDEHFDRASSWATRWCGRSRPTVGILQVDFRATAKIDTDEDEITMFVDGLNLKYDLRTEWSPCTATP